LPYQLIKKIKNEKTYCISVICRRCYDNGVLSSGWFETKVQTPVDVAPGLFPLGEAYDANNVSEMLLLVNF
jgi:hypothetical protein